MANLPKTVDTPAPNAVAIPLSSQFPVLSFDADTLKELMQENLSGMVPRLQRVPWPTGGNTSFKVATDEGEQRWDTITGLVVHHVPNRIFWQQTFDESGGGDPPDCQSPDGIHGYGNPSDPTKTGLMHPMLKSQPDLPETNPDFAYACSKCPLSQFSKDGTRPRCGERHPLFIIPQSRDEEDINLLPIIVSVPPSSLQVWSTFAGQLLAKGVSFRRAVIEITLVTEKGGPKGNIDYSKLVVKRVGMLSMEQFAFMRQYAAELEPLFTRLRESREAVEVTADESIVDGPVEPAEKVRTVRVDATDVDPGGDGAGFDDFETLDETGRPINS